VAYSHIIIYKYIIKAQRIRYNEHTVKYETVTRKTLKLHVFKSSLVTPNSVIHSMPCFNFGFHFEDLLKRI